MTEELTGTVAAPPTDAPASGEDNVRKHELFVKLTRQLADAEKRLSSVNDAAKAAEEARLAEQGKWKDIADQRAAELAATTARHQHEMLTRDADLALVSAGLSHPALRKGYISDYLAASAEERIPLTDWAKAIREAPENAPLFNAAAPPVGAGPTGGAAPRAGAALTLDEIKSGLADFRDPKRNTAAQIAAKEGIAAGRWTARDLI